jgi:hypothetical protein
MDLLLDGNRGIYIPKQFIETYGVPEWQGISQEQTDILLNPDHEDYFEVWEKVLESAFIIEDGIKHTLYQDGDLWLVSENETISID